MRANRSWLVAIGAGSLLIALSGFAAGASDTAPPLRDGWTDNEIGVLASLRLNQLPAAPPDPSNAVDRQPEAAALGKRLFADSRFSGNQAVSCATCHEADKQFQDGRPLGRGMSVGTRRAMPLVGAGHATWLFWDGRKDSLWAQALGPLEDPAEHGGNRTQYVRLLETHYRADYEAIFGPLPELSGLPEDAGPLGTPAEQAAWARLDSASRDNVSRAFANMGKSIAAYVKTLTYGDSRFDRYVEELVTDAPAPEPLLTAQEVNGLRVFIGKGQCVTCHNGPLFTDQHFHNTGVPPRDPARPDRGRAPAVARVQSDEFNCMGAFSDATTRACEELRFIVSDDPALEAAFKTPSLRNVSLRPPYMHAGQIASLAEVITHYTKAPAAAIGHSELSDGRSKHSERARIRLTAKEASDLVAFLGTLSSPIEEPIDALLTSSCRRRC